MTDNQEVQFRSLANPRRTTLMNVPVPQSTVPVNSPARSGISLLSNTEPLTAAPVLSAAAPSDGALSDAAPAGLASVSPTSATPFAMVGSDDAAVCVDGVCTIPE